MPHPGQLIVVLYGSVVGTVERTTRFSEPTFTYGDDYLQSGTVPLSVRMPLRSERYGPKFLNPFLDGLLPENSQTRQQWAVRLETDSDDSFSLLARMGWDCAGAVQFCPPDDLDEMRAREGATEPLTEKQMAGRLRDLRDDSASWALPDEHWSLPGQQEKFTLTKRSDGWHLAKGSTPTTHIVKPGIGRMHHQALVEHVTMVAGAKVDVRMAKTQFMRFEDQTAIFVERFDRVALRDGTITRLHQEDFCQATGFPPSRKYEAPNGPGLTAFTQVIDKHSSQPRADRLALADFTAINYVAGAPDGHSKNLSLALLPGRTSIAPLYDIATSFPYDESRNAKLREVAVSVGGRRQFGQVLAKHWDEAAMQIGIPADQFRERVVTMATDFPDAWATALTETDAPEAKEILNRSKDRLARHCADILTRLEGTARLAINSPARAPARSASNGDERPTGGGSRRGSADTGTGTRTSTQQRHIVPNESGGWDVTDPDGQRLSVRVRTQQDAIQQARRILARSGGELIIHGRDGRIRNSSTIRPSERKKQSEEW